MIKTSSICAYSCVSDAFTGDKSFQLTTWGVRSGMYILVKVQRFLIRLASERPFTIASLL